MTDTKREVKNTVRDAFGAEFTLETCIRRNVSLAEAPSHGKTIFEYAPTSNGAKDYHALAEELARRVGE
jgi:chromosome partitioning protein